MGRGYSKTAVEMAIETANKRLAAEAQKFEPPKEEKVEIIWPEEKRGFFSRLLKLFKK